MPFLTTAAGYLANPDATRNCGYCQMSNGGDYVGNFGYGYEQKWSDWGKLRLLSVDEVYGLTIHSNARHLSPLLRL